ncbi:uncharacterized protein LOC135078218 isoform X1 [Ostrinia nubilalis]|uniref:uncharacterized protein LOC135078218 isoform X1 n=1 Tax=Ostrinia nubilalis TaxID=29057 RepID=UPI0030824242
MPPNFVDVSYPEPVTVEDGPKENGGPPSPGISTHAGLKAVRSLTTLLTHLFIGIVVGVSLFWSFRNGVPIGPTPQHVVLCVIGFQFLMAEAILSLAPDSWCSTLNLKHKRWVHTGLQLVGSILALVGCFIKIVDKNVNFNTLHGQYALVSMVFTSVSLVNGLTSLYAYELRKFIPGILSKLTHICFGAVALVTASVSLCYGFDKNSFRNAVTSPFTDTLIIMTGALTTIIIINPLLTMYAKFLGVIKK